jgi:hypothetical protein
MSGSPNDKLTSTDSATASRRRGFDWPHALVELATVVVGILIALAINNWAQARHDAIVEAGYLDRLLSDSAENATMLQERINLHTQRAATLAHVTTWLTSGTQPPTDDELSLLRDVSLRGLLEQAETRHEEALRLDRFLDTLQRITEPLNRYRQWEIDPNSRFGVGCHFDLQGMRSDPATASILAQIYRDHTLNRSFREQELAAVRAVHDRIIKLHSER